MLPRRLSFAPVVDGPYAWVRLGVSLVLGMIGGVGMWSVVVALPAVQTEFGVARGSASLPYTLTMVGLATGNVLLGRAVDRVGMAPLILGAAAALGIGYTAAGLAGSLTQFTLAQGLLIAMFGAAATFGPLMADVSHWFRRRRGLAVAICAAGNYFAGMIWPPVVEYGIGAIGWRHTHILIGIFCFVSMSGLSLLVRRRPETALVAAAPAPVAGSAAGSGFSIGATQALLCVAGFSCCVAMAMPQVHLVAYCGDLGYGPARGAQMLSLMFAFGIVSRISSGFIADRIGGLGTLLLGSGLQLLALLLYLGFDGLFSLYVISALFGLFQGGIVPSYAIIVREQFPAREAGARIGVVLTATMVGMAAGGWMSGAIFDLTGSYQAAFANGAAWNLLNFALASLLLWRSLGRRGLAAA
ncbi:MAG: MFS transporter [Alphaproteobacteria bacterium]|nr:MFS transporter [Alphaproteobacteria bacterium]